MIQAVIFDCFGVLTSEGWIPFKRRHFGGDALKEQEATDLNKQANAGLIGTEDFVAGIADLAQVPKADVWQVITSNQPNEELFTYIQEVLKPRYKIGMLSNAGSDMLQDMLSDEQLALFDAIDLSFETGHVKPEVKAYTLLADRLGVDVSRCLFVDDQDRHCSGAREAGMRAVKYQDFTQARQDIEKILSDPEH